MWLNLMSLGNFPLRLEILMSSVYSLHAIQLAIFAMWLMGNQMLCSLVSLDIFIYPKKDIPCLNTYSCK